MLAIVDNRATSIAITIVSASPMLSKTGERQTRLIPQDYVAHRIAG